MPKNHQPNNQLQNSGKNLLEMLSRYFRGSASRLCTRLVRQFSSKTLNTPPTANDLCRPAGIASMMRLPYQDTSKGLDACFIGIPLDTGTTNRPGTRFGPRQIRTESVLLRPVNQATGAAPFESLMVADCGDVHVNLYHLPKACDRITEHYIKLIKNSCKPLTLGGDHTVTYPILKAIKEQHGPVGLIHIDAHLDTTDLQDDERITHGTTFRRAFDDNCLDPKRVWQIGIRGSGNTSDDYTWSREQGFHVIPATDCWHKSLTPLINDIKKEMGDGPCYISFDIDALDPAHAPGTGTPEIGGLTSIQALELIRGCKGLNVVGADVVEVSPPFDNNGTTALVGANLLFEMLCILPGVKYYPRP
ncbi:agmatinase, mitochondrial-like [Lineus longissimus]|uniref:agmatinase, mitochondrial-like n=1 Tax=Lineus longissimus TaxID=88925 RepID=UPI002B4C2FB9